MSTPQELAAQKTQLEGTVAALTTELAQLALGSHESLLKRLIARFVDHEGSRLQTALTAAQATLDTVNAALAALPPAPAAAPTSPALPAGIQPAS